MDEEDSTWIDCWQCGGVGMIAGCFEDCCSGADCDPEDAELCCWPNTCDICHGDGGWYQDEAAAAALSAQEKEEE